jgi:hypothetical protein
LLAGSGVIKVTVQAVHEKFNLYIRFQRKTRNACPGNANLYCCFDAKGWKRMSLPVLHKKVWG